MTGDLCIIGEDIPAERPVVRSLIDGKLYIAGRHGGHAGEYVGDAVETLREGFRAMVRGSEVREDDA